MHYYWTSQRSRQVKSTDVWLYPFPFSVSSSITSLHSSRSKPAHIKIIAWVDGIHHSRTRAHEAWILAALVVQLIAGQLTGIPDDAACHVQLYKGSTAWAAGRLKLLSVTHVHTCMHMHACTHTRTYTHTHTHAHTPHTHARTHTTHTHTRTHTHTQTHAHTYTHTNTHTNTNIHKLKHTNTNTLHKHTHKHTVCLLHVVMTPHQSLDEITSPSTRHQNRLYKLLLHWF